MRDLCHAVEGEITIEDGFPDEVGCIRVTAPRGHHWTGEDLHELVHPQPIGVRREDIWQDIYERLVHTLCKGEIVITKCTAESCDNPDWHWDDSQGRYDFSI